MMFLSLNQHCHCQSTEACENALKFSCVCVLQ